MPSPDATVIRIKCKEWQRDEVRRLANLQGKTIQRYAFDRLMEPWSDKDLEDLGFGLILRELRYKDYPDWYIKKFTGDLLGMLRDAPRFTEEYAKIMEYVRDDMLNEEAEKEAMKYE